MKDKKEDAMISFDSYEDEHMSSLFNKQKTKEPELSPFDKTFKKLLEPSPFEKKGKEKHSRFCHTLTYSFQD